MNNSETIVKLIKELMKQKGVSNKQMSENVQNININTIAQLAKGREISYVSLAILQIISTVRWITYLVVLILLMVHTL